ncbi:family 43 glycosylhydrolase [Streptococcaceae bacterium ESL0687]|nr:family 43 glycosylhydrolase [Streptococcaceae bacterium ESL0687]
MKENSRVSNGHEIYYQPKDIWVGDIMPYGKDGKFYIYHQRDTRNPGPFGEPFGWALATTENFIEYEDFGESLLRGSDDERDQFIYAGSVFEADGKIHAFYTGYNREFLKEGKTSQVLLHAESDDFVHWTKSEKALELEPQEGYDIRNWRDPFVVWDDEKEEYLLILGARKGQDKHLQTGRLVKFTSKDLKDWKFGGDFWAPGLYTMFEMPELFKIGDWWYLVYSEYSDGNKILYRMSQSLEGPWIKPKDEAFDGRAYYAGRTAFDGKRRVLFGWVPTKDQDDDMNNYLWGGTFVPHEVYQREDFTLGVKPIDEVWEVFTDKKELENVEILTVDTREEVVLVEDSGKFFSLETTISFDENLSDFSLRFYKNLETDESYEFRFNLDESYLSFDKNPCYPWFQYMDKGLRRPLDLKAGNSYTIKVIVDDNIMTLYIDGVALNVRVYNQFGSAISLTATNGCLLARDINFSNRIVK